MRTRIPRLGAWAVAVLAVAIIPVTADAAFSGRLPATPGGADYQAYYDNQLGITWAANAALFGIGTWGEATLWADALTIGGVGGWRLASMDVDGDGLSFDCGSNNQAACLDNEYGHLYWFGAGLVHSSGVTPGTPGPFTGLVAEHYWSSTQRPVPMPIDARFFGFATGSPGIGSKTANALRAWAVHDGDVAPVPLPAGSWPLCGALVLLWRVASARVGRGAALRHRRAAAG